ncbi:MAG: hypothetical protein ACRCWI_08710 [Brevinema sp.]
MGFFIEGYFILPPENIDGDGVNYHVFQGEQLGKDVLILNNSICGRVQRYKDRPMSTDLYFETKTELESFFTMNHNKKICASCSENHKHADLR